MTLGLSEIVFLANSMGQQLESHLAGVATRAVEIFDKLCPESVVLAEHKINDLQTEIARRQRSRLRSFVFWSGLLHDLGKVDPTFQKFLTDKAVSNSSIARNDLLTPDAEFSRKRSGGSRFFGPFHNELSWLILNSLRQNLLKENNDDPRTRGLIVAFSIFLGAKDDDFNYHGNSASVAAMDPESYKPFDDYVMMPVYWHHPLNPSDKDHRKARFETVDSLLASFGTEENRTSDIIVLIENAQLILKKSLEEITRSRRLFSPESDVISKLDGHLSISTDLALSELNRVRDKRNPPFYPAPLDGSGLPTNSLDPNIEWRRTRRVSWQQKLILHILVEADRQISRLTREELVSYLSGKEIEFKDQLIGTQFPHVEIDKSKLNKRTQEQLKVADRLSKAHVSVCAADPGAGKTSIALMTHSLAVNNTTSPRPRRLFIALPQQQQIDGLYSTICKDMERLGLFGVTVEGVYNGQRQYPLASSEEARSLSPNLLEADICLLTVDRLLSPSFSWRQDEVMALLFGNVVFDEFHAISYIDRAIPAFLDFIEMKKFCRGGGFLLCLSGTPNPALLRLANLPSNVSPQKDGYSFFVGRSELTAVHDETSKFRVVKSNDGQDASVTLSSRVDLLDDTLVAHLQLSDCQKHFVLLDRNRIKATLVHSAFTDYRRKEVISKILREYGKKDAAEGVVVSAKMLNASFDLNFKHLHNVAHTADFDCQILARKNRYGGKPNGDVVFYLTGISKSGDRRIFSESKFGYSAHHVAWNDHLQRVIGEEQKDLSHRKAMQNLYDDFWNVEKNVRDFIQPLLSSAIEGQRYLHDFWMPSRRRTANRVQQQPRDSCSPYSVGFRGSSLFTTAIRVDEVNRCLTQLTGDNLLSEGSSFYQEQLMEKTKSIVSNASKGSRFNDFGFTFHKKIFRYESGKFLLGRSPDLPLIWSIIGVHVGAIDENSHYILSEYYHDELGLADVNILDDFLLSRVGMNLSACIQAFKNPSRETPLEENLLLNIVDD